MSYLTRQHRLRSLLGADHSGYVFQVFAAYLVQSLSLDFMYQVAEEFELDTNAIGERLKLPDIQIGKHTFESGYVGTKGSALIKTQLVYTSAAYSPQSTDHRMHTDVDCIHHRYEDAKYKIAPHIRGSYYDQDTGEGHQFAFMHRISEYCFEHHPPRETGVLKPCTLIPDVIIQPHQSDLPTQLPNRNP